MDILRILTSVLASVLAFLKSTVKSIKKDYILLFILAIGWATYKVLTRLDVMSASFKSFLGVIMIMTIAPATILISVNALGQLVKRFAREKTFVDLVSTSIVKKRMLLCCWLTLFWMFLISEIGISFPVLAVIVALGIDL